MKVFRIVYEHDGEVKKEPGKVATAIEREELRYAAETIDQVWNEIQWLRKDLAATIIAVHEEHPGIIVLAQEDGWCCEKGQRLNVRVCPECEEISRGYSEAMGVDRSPEEGAEKPRKIL